MADITKQEQLLLDIINKQKIKATELDLILGSQFISNEIHSSLYSLIAKDLVKLDSNLIIIPIKTQEDEETAEKNKLVHIDGGLEWRSDELLGWAFDQLNEYALLGNFESIALAFRFSDHTTYAVFEGSDLIGLAGAASLLHNSIIDHVVEYNSED